MKKIGAVLNKESGTLPPEKRTERLKRLGKEISGRVAPGCLAIVSEANLIPELKRLVQKEKVDLLIAGGGDGTISAAVNFTAGSNTGLLILPLGTKNNFAADLGIPADPFESISILEGEPNIQLVDIGNLNGHYFVNNATIGIYPELVKEREKKTKKLGWQKWRAKIAASIIVLQQMPMMRMTVESEDSITRLFTPFLFVGNNEYEENFEKGYTRSSLTRGNLWLCMSKSPRIWSLYTMALELSLKGIRDTSNLETRLLEEVTVTPRSRNVTVAVDGENIRMETPLRFKIQKKILRVITG